MPRNRLFKQSVRRTIVFDKQDVQELEEFCVSKGISFGVFVRACTLAGLQKAKRADSLPQLFYKDSDK